MKPGTLRQFAKLVHNTCRTTIAPASTCNTMGIVDVMVVVSVTAKRRLSVFGVIVTP